MFPAHAFSDHDDAADDRAFKALAHADRRWMLRAVSAGERSVGELATLTGLAQPTASQHLRVLRDAGLVDVRVDANRRLYTVDFARVAAVRATLDDLWSTKLDALRSVAESDEARRRVVDDRPGAAVSASVEEES